MEIKEIKNGSSPKRVGKLVSQNWQIAFIYGQ